MAKSRSGRHRIYKSWVDFLIERAYGGRRCVTSHSGKRLRVRPSCEHSATMRSACVGECHGRGRKDPEVVVLRGSAVGTWLAAGDTGTLRAPVLASRRRSSSCSMSIAWCSVLCVPPAASWRRRSCAYIVDALGRNLSGETAHASGSPVTEALAHGRNRFAGGRGRHEPTIRRP